MTAWDQDELRAIARADDLHVAPFREDGKTYGTPTWIWSVAVDGELYVRAYSGRSSRWHQAALRQKAGRITAAGMMKDVVFEAVEGPINDRASVPLAIANRFLAHARSLHPAWRSRGYNLLWHTRVGVRCAEATRSRTFRASFLPPFGSRSRRLRRAPQWLR